GSDRDAGGGGLHRRPRHERRLEREHLAGAEPEVAPTGLVPADGGRHRDADDVDGLGHVLHPQGDPQVGVGPDVVVHRPAGALNNNIRANTNLRISLRVQDVAESVDVIGVPVAATIGRYQAGRGYLRLGPGEVFPFQTALVTGSTVETASTGITVRP